MNEILKYFPDLTERQQAQMAALYDLYADWNQKINVISRKDIEHLYEHHVLHSLAIARFVRWKEGTKVLDFGTGGGFPGIPLAILFPDCQFHLIDGTGKKIRVVNEVAQAIGLENVKASHLRGEEEKGKYDFVVSRAVMPLPSLVRIVSKNISKTQRNAIANGVICLKGGDVSEETQPFGRVVETIDISEWFDEEWFNEKHIIYLPL
jgi:16S rRNA (guanine527-N7)-methyltransferase